MEALRAPEIVDWVAGEPCVHFATQRLGNGSDSEEEVRTLLIICRCRARTPGAWESGHNGRSERV